MSHKRGIGQPIRLANQIDSKTRDKIAELIETKQSEYVLSPILEDFVYTTTRALDIGDYHGTKNKRALWEHAVNKNDDLFNWDELHDPIEIGGVSMPRYLTFRTAGVFVNHQSKDPESAIGLVFDSVVVDDVYDDMHVVILMGIDKHKAPNIARSLMTYPERVATSMGCIIKSSQCTCCGEIIGDYNNLCNCLRYHRGGRKNGRKVAELLRQMEFYEQSIVTSPAAPKSLVIDALHGSGLVPGAILKVASTEQIDGVDPLLEVMYNIYQSIRTARTWREKKQLNDRLDILISKLQTLVG